MSVLNPSIPRQPGGYSDACCAGNTFVVSLVHRLAGGASVV